MCAALSEKVVSEVYAYLMEKKKTYEGVCRKFEEKYASVEYLEKKIRKEGVPETDHTLWDDLIEWRNVISEAEKIDAMLKGLHAP